MTKSGYEALALLNEECGEVVQAIGKILRHGPYNGWGGVSNIEQLSIEIADVIGAIKILRALNLLALPLIEKRLKEKFEDGNINKYIHNFEVKPEWYKEKI